MNMPLSKPEQLEQLIETIALINHVRVELNSYYPDMSKSACYKVNCKIDQDRLEKSIKKLNRIQTEIEYELNNVQITPVQATPVLVRSVDEAHVHS